MSDTLINAIIGLFSVIAGTILGWFLAQRQQSKTQQFDRYRADLLDVREAIVHVLAVYQDKSKRQSYELGEVVGVYVTTIGKLQPYADRIGQKNFSRLSHLIRGEMFEGGFEIEALWAIRTIDILVS
ncbi:MAG: hypothetical protein CVU44_20870 [Chloroflexi bacterium HGW-Chloroflexi-6]|nr:MAG: hypothetical protein CVU44_20870 [Chloroflexi bacterium HGW-Chloroflexi-6]